MNLGIIGCGDFLRYEEPTIRASRDLTVTAVFDADGGRAAKWAGVFGARVAGSAREIITARDVDIVGVYVPPFARGALVVAAAEAGKPIVTTKPLAPEIRDAEAMVEAVERSGVPCAVLYRRSADPLTETYRKVLSTGEIGRLAMYRLDSIHHYPQWNTWALDPRRNGGPFMDAMVHNLNIARYLMGRRTAGALMQSDNYTQRLPCNDTECLRLDFEGGGTAHLFISWAADLAVHAPDANFREVLDWCFLITSERWLLTDGRDGDGPFVRATRNGETRRWPVRDLDGTRYDDLVGAIRAGAPLPPRAVGVREAAEDIRIIRETLERAGKRVPLEI